MLTIKVLQKSMDGERVEFAVRGWDIPPAFYEKVVGEKALVNELLRQLGYYTPAERKLILSEILADTVIQIERIDASKPFSWLKNGERVEDDAQVALRGKPSEENLNSLNYDSYTPDEKLEIYGPPGEKPWGR